ncbi:MAG: HEAT repeat domain-containing protein [Anaerolineae bacterium]|nr:HEAT repeat domain-containing protein [Anaerolineae bacterium]
MTLSLDVLLDELRERTEMPDPASLYHLSSLETQGQARVREVWPRLPVELRRRLIARLVELTEADFEVDFGAIFRLGLEDEDAEVRTAAVEGLWEDEDVRLVPLLATALREDEAVTVRAAAATSLGRFVLMGELKKIRPEPHALVYEALLAACQAAGEHGEVQRRALESLAYVGGDTVIELIREAYAAPEEKVRISAVFAMGRSADPRWARQVRQELFSPNPELRYEAARACGELELDEAVPELAELADDVDLEVQEAALCALGQIGGDEAREILERYCLAENEATQAAAEAALDELEFMHGDLSEFFTRLIGERIANGE